MGRADVVRDYGGVSADDRRAERRRKLLDAGRQLWGESGISEVTVRGACNASGLTPRYFYEHFPNREALLIAVSDEVMQELISVLVTFGLGEPGDLERKLRAALKAFLDLVEGDPKIHRIIASDVSGLAGLIEMRAKSLDNITALVLEYGPALLDFTPPSQAEVERAARFIVGGINQVVDAWIRDPQESTAELAEACVQLCLSVVRAGAARAKG